MVSRMNNAQFNHQVNRTKLTDENFRVKLREGIDGHWYQYLRMEDGFEDGIVYGHLKHQILDDQEIVEKLIEHKKTCITSFCFCETLRRNSKV